MEPTQTKADWDALIAHLQGSNKWAAHELQNAEFVSSELRTLVDRDGNDEPPPFLAIEIVGEVSRDALVLATAVGPFLFGMELHLVRRSD